jgi:hypothetical protein
MSLQAIDVRTVKTRDVIEAGGTAEKRPQQPLYEVLYTCTSTRAARRQSRPAPEQEVPPATREEGLVLRFDSAAARHHDRRAGAAAGSVPVRAGSDPLS